MSIDTSTTTTTRNGTPLAAAARDHLWGHFTRHSVYESTDTGVMQIVAVTDPLVVGFTRQAMIGIKTQGDVGPVADQLCEIPQIDYVVTTAGSFDLLVEVVCEGDAELLDVLMTQIRTIPEVTHTETFVYLKLNKQHYDWGTR